MMIKREDLLAAATAGKLHYGEIDPLLVFLAQREAAARSIVPVSEYQEKPRWRSPYLLHYLGGLLAIGLATLGAMLFTSQTVGALGVVALLWFTLLYALCAVGAAAWLDIRSGNVLIGLLAVLGIAFMPLAALALQGVLRS
ncbi:MAG TPA: hypothetical protein VHK70_06625 [Burkholderiaceae bacterium]|nr:hypothetical protein [Burkholderiaceae bacterium]